MDNSLCSFSSPGGTAAVGGYLFVRSRRPAQEQLYCNFQMSRLWPQAPVPATAGRQFGMCPRCNKAFTFPPSS